MNQNGFGSRNKGRTMAIFRNRFEI